MQYKYDEYIEEFVKCLKEKFRNVEFKNKNVNIFSNDGYFESMGTVKECAELLLKKLKNEGIDEIEIDWKDC